MTQQRDHGGGLDAAISRFGGQRHEWIDLSTGINPVPYSISELDHECWTALPDKKAFEDLIEAACAFWDVPEQAALLPAPGASALIAQIPALASPGTVHIPAPTYNEHAAAFEAHGWRQSQDEKNACVLVNPNNPTGHWYSDQDVTAPFCIIDESFADIAPEHSLISHAARPGVIVLKSFGKFWGLAGLRLGFAIGDPNMIARLNTKLGPWAVSGPALALGARALRDTNWAQKTRKRLSQDAERLDKMMIKSGANITGGTTLFRLYEVGDASAWHERLARSHILSRIFPYSNTWLRLGLPGPDQWSRLEQAL